MSFLAGITRLATPRGAVADAVICAAAAAYDTNAAVIYANADTNLDDGRCFGQFWHFCSLYFQYAIELKEIV